MLNQGPKPITDPNNQPKARNIDIHLAQQVYFSDLCLPSYYIECLKSLHYLQPTPIQYHSIKRYTQHPRSLICHAKSGTGKTLSFLTIIIYELLLRESLEDKTHAVILLPTRELAMQVYQCCQKILQSRNHVPAKNQEQTITKARMAITAMLAIGGSLYQDDRKAYLRNRPHILIGTLGRISDFFANSLISAESIEYLVLDEGDKLFQSKNSSLGSLFRTILQGSAKLFIYSATYTEQLLNSLAPLEKRKQLLYIQTLADQSNNRIENITQNRVLLLQGLSSINNPRQESPESTSIELNNIKKFKYIPQDSTDVSRLGSKLACLIELLRNLNFTRCLVFLEKKALVEQINEALLDAQIDTLLIHGSMNQSARIRAMNRINASRVIVASDVLARGIDIELDLVILFDAYQNETFWHRIGRTGRYGKIGVAISLEDVKQWPQYHQKEVNDILQDIHLEVGDKKWFGTYMTDVGQWEPVNQQGEEKVTETNEYKYFTEPPINPGISIPSINKPLNKPISKAKKCTNHHRRQKVSSNGNDEDKSVGMITESNYLQVARQLLGCADCQHLIQSVQDLSGYRFDLLSLQL